MSVKQFQYETLLAEYSNSLSVIALLKQYRPYLEMIPSMRRPDQSVLPIPLPTVKIRQPSPIREENVRPPVTLQMTQLPCDVAILMCDPEWKIKTGSEIFLYIHRPEEDFSNLLGRWRQTQVLLHHNYEWIMPLRHRHIVSEGTDDVYPLFILFPETAERIKRGLNGACLPFITHWVDAEENENAVTEPPLSSGSVG
jgi:hypothetical protein